MKSKNCDMIRYINILICLTMIFSVPMPAMADQPMRAGGDAAKTRDVARVEHKIQYVPEFSQLLSYNILMQLSQSERINYLHSVRKMLIEMESLTPSESGTPGSGKNAINSGVDERLRQTLITEVDRLFAILVPEAKADVYDDAAKAGYYCEAGVPYLGGFWGKTWKCKVTVSKQGKPDSFVYPEAKQAPAGRNPLLPGSFGEAPLARKPAVQTPSTALPVPDVKPNVKPNVMPEVQKPSFNEGEYDYRKSEVALKDKTGKGYDSWAESAPYICGFKPMNKASCEKQSSVRNANKGCLIGGIPSVYRGNSCISVSTLCYTKTGEQLTNGKCENNPNVSQKFTCKQGETVCSVDIGRRLNDHNFKNQDKSNGAFCAPLSGSGSMSASALCMEMAEKYRKSQGDLSVNDILASSYGNGAVAEKRWNEFKKNMYAICGGTDDMKKEEVTTRVNCEACQVMKYRTAQMRYEFMKLVVNRPGAPCATDEDIEKYLENCKVSPESCGRPPSQNDRNRSVK